MAERTTAAKRLPATPASLRDSVSSEDSSFKSPSTGPRKKVGWGGVGHERADRLLTKLSTMKAKGGNKPKPTYNPHDFWQIVFASYGSGIPSILPRALLLMPYTAGIALLDHYDCMGEFGSTVKAAPRQCRSSATVPPPGAPGRSGQRGTPKKRPAHWAPSHRPGYSSSDSTALDHSGSDSRRSRRRSRCCWAC